MTDRDPRRTILARRAQFVAAAIASVSLVDCKKDDGPPPGPCLSVSMQPDDAATQPATSSSTTATPSATDAGPERDAGPSPQPKPPAPMPCLSVKPH